MCLYNVRCKLKIFEITFCIVTTYSEVSKSSQVSELVIPTFGDWARIQMSKKCGIVQLTLQSVNSVKPLIRSLQRSFYF